MAPESEIKVYRYLQHIFGAKCAPSCSNYALLRAAECNGLQYPIGDCAVKRNCCMEGLFKSVKTTVEALELQQQLVAILKFAGFNLTKWVSNVKEVIRIPQ